MSISLLGLLLLIVMSAICGAIAKAIIGFHAGGLLATIGLGFVGGLVGWLLADALNAPTILSFNLGGVMFPFVWALLGTILVVAVVAMLSRRRTTTYRRRAW